MVESSGSGSFVNMDSKKLDGTQLIKKRRDIPVPFDILVRKDKQELQLTICRFFRVLPGKRLVALAECEGKMYVLKIFLGRTASKYVLKESDGAKAISDLGLQTPKFMWKAGLFDGKGFVLAFQYLENCVELEELWNNTKEVGEKVKVLENSVGILAAMHNKGLRQKDIHLNNFVVFEGDIFTIDGGGMDLSKEGRPLEKRSSLENLARFFSQFEPGNDGLIDQVFPLYQKLRSWPKDNLEISTLRMKTHQKREVRKKHFISKTLRDCSRFICKSSLRRFMVCERTRYLEEIVDLLAEPDKFIQDAIEKGKLLKNGNSATVALVDTDQGPLVIKRYNSKSLWRIFRKAFRRNRARNSWINAHQLDFLGISSVKPVAMLELGFGPFTKTAYFVSDYIEGNNADFYCSDEEEIQQSIEKETRDQMVKILVALKDARISHGDMKASNFRITSDSVVLLDLDAMKTHSDGRTFKKAFKKDLGRFLENWKNKPELYQQFRVAAETINQGLPVTANLE